MKNIIFVAPPAAGKGTQSELLVGKYNYEHISTGDLLRDKQNDNSLLGNKIKDLLSKGELVDDEIVTALLKEKLSSITNNFILDGYPRNIKQAKLLDNLLNELNLSIGVVIYLNIDEDTAIKRALGRISCPKCYRIYNRYDDLKKPKNDNICDDCGAKLIGRSDDNEESFKVRFNNYINNTKPLIDYYKSLGLLEVIEKLENSNEIFELIEKVI